MAFAASSPMPATDAALRETGRRRGLVRSLTRDPRCLVQWTPFGKLDWTRIFRGPSLAAAVRAAEWVCDGSDCASRSILNRDSPPAPLAQAPSSRTRSTHTAGWCTRTASTRSSGARAKIAATSAPAAPRVRRSSSARRSRSPREPPVFRGRRSASCVAVFGTWALLQEKAADSNSPARARPPPSSARPPSCASEARAVSGSSSTPARTTPWASASSLDAALAKPHRRVAIPGRSSRESSTTWCDPTRWVRSPAPLTLP